MNAAAFQMAADGTLQRVAKPAPARPCPDVEALDWLLFYTGWNGGVIPVYVDGALNPSMHVPVGPSEANTGLLRRLERWGGCQVELGLPERAARQGGASAASILWVWCETREQVLRAVRFRPQPSMVLKVGKSCRRLLIWALEEVVPYVSLVPANKRIAYRLRAPQNRADPDKFRCPVPGLCLTVGRKRPVPVVVTRRVEDTSTMARVTKGLREPPAPWIDRIRSGEITR